MMEWYMFNEIKKLKEKGLKKTQVARALNSDSRTIKKYWNMTSEEFEVARLSFKQRITGRKMDLYRNEILKWLQEHNDLSGAQVFDWLKEKFSDFSMSERTVRDYVAKLRKEYAIPKLKITREYLAVPESPMGKQAQVDMGQIKLKNSFGKLVKLYLFTMILSNSRYKFSQWQTSPFTSKDLIKMHNLAFKYFNGMPKEIVYDQDRALFVNENSGDIILSSEFQKYINLSGLKIHLCRAYDPESNGKVEAVVKYVKYNFAKNRKFTDIEEFNQLNNEWLIRTGNGKSHSITKKVPAEVFAVEKQHLMPIPSSISFCKENTNNIVLYSLGKDNTVTYKSNRYQLPKGTYSTKYKEVRVEIKEDDILFFRSDENTLITSYKISKEKGMLFSHSNFMRDIIGTTALGGLKKDILEYFSDKQDITLFLEMIEKEKPRYLKEQFQKLKKIISENSLEIINNILKESIFKGITNLSIFEDLITASTVKKTVKTKSVSAPTAKIPEIMKNVVPEIRKISEYQEKLVKNL